MKVSFKYLLIGAFIASFLLISYIISISQQGKLKIVFCDVGQGDAAYIRTPDNHEIVIDGGPNDRINDCLGKYMDFWDRSIDMLILSHPQKDHMQGFISLLDRYKVEYFIAPPVGNQTQGYQDLLAVINRKHVAVKNAYRGDTIDIGEVHLSFLWPDKQWVAKTTSLSQCTGSCKAFGQGNVLGMATTDDLNDFSSYIHLKYGTFDALFTGDGDSKIQPQIMTLGDLTPIELLKFPHHGSKTGMLPEFLALIKPELAIISVGRNSYGHPNSVVLEMLSQQQIPFKRTDREGDMVVTSDGAKWAVEKGKN